MKKQPCFDPKNVVLQAIKENLKTKQKYELVQEFDLLI